MKRMKIVSLGLMASLLMAVGVAGATYAAWSPNLKSSTGTVTVAKDEVNQGSLYATGEAVTIDGTVTGTLYCAGGTITINGTVEGDVLCAGQKVTINGTVGSDVRVAGQWIEVNGKVGGSVSAFGEDIKLTKEGSVAGDVNGAGRSFTLDGTVGRDVAIGAQLLAINSTVNGNVDAGIAQLQFSDTGTVLGNVNYSANKELSFDVSHVKGSVSFNPATDKQTQNGGRRFMGFAAVAFVLMLVMSALAIVLVAPRFVHRSSELFSKQAPLTILLGFAFVVGGPMVVTVLLLSVVFIPLGLALLFGWLGVLFLSNLFFAYWVGSALLRSQANIVVRMFGGVLVLAIALMIPVLNVLVMFVATIIGSGMLVMTLTNGYKRPEYQLATTKKVPAKSKK